MKFGMKKALVDLESIVTMLGPAHLASGLIPDAQRFR